MNRSSALVQMAMADRGDLGAVADPTWEERWAHWTPEAVQQQFADAAKYGVLGWAQVKALLQDLPPPPRGWPAPPTVLAGNEAIVERIGQDMARGDLSKAPTPEELAAWCDARAHNLPSTFVEALQAQRALRRDVSGAGSYAASQASVAIALPPWVPRNVTVNPPTVPKRTRGRPKTSTASHDSVVAAGSEILWSAAARGEVMTLEQIANQLAGKSVAGAAVPATVLRLLKGKLDVRAAKAKAIQVSQKRLGK